MTQTTTKAPEVTIGLDLGDRYSYLVALDETGTTIEEGRVSTTRVALRKRFESGDSSRIAIEAGTHSPWVSDLLKECGHDVFVANPRKTRMIYENDRKSDKVDAEWLARVARMDPKLLAPIEHRETESRADLAIARARAALVSTRTQLVNHIRGAVKSLGGRLPKCSAECFPKKVRSSIPKELRPALSPMLSVLTAVTAKINEYEKRIEKLAREKYSETQLLRQVTGVGTITSFVYVLTIEDPRRFRRSRAVGSYLGLRPGQRDSGDRNPQLRITKAGDSMLRRLLVGSAHYILGAFGPDCDLRRWGLAMAARNGKASKMKAIVAVARKLAVLLHRLWSTGEVYEPLRNSAPQPHASTT